MSQYDWSKCKRDSLERLVEEIDRWSSTKVPWDESVLPVIDAIRAEAAPKLRTKAEVDAEIVTTVRQCYGTGNLAWLGEDLTKLCAEPIAPEAEPKCSECGGIHGPGNTNTLCPRSSNYDKTLEERLKKQWTDPDPCSCEEALALRKKLEAVDALLLSLRQRSHAFSRGTVTRDVLERLFMELSECLK